MLFLLHLNIRRGLLSKRWMKTKEKMVAKYMTRPTIREEMDEEKVAPADLAKEVEPC